MMSQSGEEGSSWMMYQANGGVDGFLMLMEVVRVECCPSSDLC
jgi:hypothetical protein